MIPWYLQALILIVLFFGTVIAIGSAYLVLDERKRRTAYAKREIKARAKYEAREPYTSTLQTVKIRKGK